MIASTRPPATNSKTRKLLLQLSLGAIAGGLSMVAMLWLIDRQNELSDDLSRVAALGVAVVYGLMALLVALGTLAPRIGARALNVEDAAELGEERSNLLAGAGLTGLVAILLGALALGPIGDVPGLLPRQAALILASGAGLLLMFLSYLFRGRGDELMRISSLEASSWALALVFIVFGSWAILAQLAGAPHFAPLDFITGFFGIYLLALFVALGRRGMLKPR